MARVKIVNFGCSSNLAESEMIAGILKKSNHEIVENNEDIAIVNACSVKGHSINKWLKEAGKNKNVIVTGCVVPFCLDRVKELNASIVSTHNISQIADAVELVLEGNRVEILGSSKGNKIALPKVRKNPIIEVIPISNGCQFNCTYCATKLIKGDLYSYPKEDIVKRARQAVEDGCKEIWITSQDTGSYGADTGSSLPKLLEEILALYGNFRVRIGMANPNHIHKHMKRIVELYKHPKMFRFLHIPVQSGSEKILKLMKRPHTTSHYYDVVERFRKEIPDITIATDIIVGFPEETDEDFRMSMELLKKTKPEVLNLSKFWKMPGTEAAGMRQIPGEFRTSRANRMMELFRSLALEKNRKLIGKECNILIDSLGKHGTYVGRNETYRPIIMKGNYSIGDELKVKIKDATALDLRAACL